MKLFKAVRTLVVAQAVMPILYAYAQPSVQMSPAAGLWGQPAAADELAQLRGGATISRSEMTVSGTTAGNSATNVLTGSNSIAAGSFANMNGLPLVVQNSGANVLIQNAVIINLQMQ